MWASEAAVIPASRLQTWRTSAEGRFGRFRRLATLERHDGTAWIPVERYGSIHDANVALDEAIGAGAQPDSMQVVDTAASATMGRLLVLVGALALGVVIALSLLLG